MFYLFLFIFREDGTQKEIKRIYQTFNEEEDFLPDDKIDFKDMMKYLILHKKYEPVGAYFRNIHMKEMRINEKG